MQKIVDKVVEIKKLKAQVSNLVDECQDLGVEVLVLTYSITITGKLTAMRIEDTGITTSAVCSGNTPETVEEFSKYLLAKEKEEIMLLDIALKIKEKVWGNEND